jgi:hypothetical protein
MPMITFVLEVADDDTSLEQVKTARLDEVLCTRSGTPRSRSGQRRAVQS